MTEKLYVGPEVESCGLVEVPIFHYAITGQTQLSGKTTAIKTLAKRAVELGYKVLVFDTKETGEEYGNFGDSVSVCMRESTDSFVLIGLLESIFRRRLTRYYGTLSRLSETAKNFDDIIERGKKLEQSTRSGFLRDAARVLWDLMERLKRETARVETVRELELPYNINRMPINQFSKEAQQLIVKNAFEDALKKYNRNVILVIDEAFKFIPQKYSSACTEAIQRVITQGAKTHLYVWIGTQFLAPTDKDPLKACAVRLLGTQDHITEVKHTLDLIPFKGFTKDDIMRLPLGHFIVVTKKFAKLTYLQPNRVPKKVASNVARGEITPEQVRDEYLIPKLKDDEKLWKEKFEEEKRRREELEKEFARQVERLSDLKAEEKIKKLIEEERQKAFKEAMAKVEEIKSQWNVEELQQTIMQLKDEKANLEKQLEKEAKAFVEVKKKADAYENLQKALAPFLPKQPAAPPGLEPGAPSEIVVVKEQPALAVETLRKPLTLSQADLLGRIAIVYAEGLLPSDKAFTVRHLNRIMEQRFGRKEAYANFPKVLTDFVAWGFFEKIRAGNRWDYRLKMKPEEAREKGLLKTIEKVEA